MGAFSVPALLHSGQRGACYTSLHSALPGRKIYPISFNLLDRIEYETRFVKGESFALCFFGFLIMRGIFSAHLCVASFFREKYGDPGSAVFARLNLQRAVAIDFQPLADVFKGDMRLVVLRLCVAGAGIVHADRNAIL